MSIGRQLQLLRQAYRGELDYLFWVVVSAFATYAVIAR